MILALVYFIEWHKVIIISKGVESIHILVENILSHPKNATSAKFLYGVFIDMQSLDHFSQLFVFPSDLTFVHIKD